MEIKDKVMTGGGGIGEAVNASIIKALGVTVDRDADNADRVAQSIGGTAVD